MSISPNLFLILYPPTFQHLSKPKIYYPNLYLLRITLTVIFIEKDYIVKFDIPMDDVKFMDVAECTEDFTHDGLDSLLGVFKSFLDVFQQGSTLAILRNDTVNILIHVCLVYFDDIGVI